MKKINNLVQEMQIKIKNHDDIVFEWIPYNQFNNIEVMGKGNFATVYSSIVYSAIWKDGPLFYDYNEKKYIRKSDKKVTLRFFNNSQNIFYKLYTEVL
ncbi:kinase-like domain-containing protein [Rhizophagus irregularis DAOM 181602=DAOM 197198]|uniref:Protein kinase domain-containing protein n=1 Tax=Rhizophagus irregularis (strain DAOM 197198w) TaxID=1432141 RepID=A0A015I2H9_RHIIW|nr:hypothetical protein RirG_264100 [Rhizophagus irregularis DAOM 197198w]GET65174.1 kinase-like domain-containing protein [Rhizophagus irregularis DAOM 181602=DAOM 197198]